MARQPNAVKERFWRRMVGRWRRSGLTVRQYCEANHLSEPSFYAWRRLLAQRDQEAASAAPEPRRPDLGRAVDQAAFIPIHLVGTTAAASPAFEIVLGNGRVLRGLAGGFDPDVLRQLLAVLEEPPC